MTKKELRDQIHARKRTFGLDELIEKSQLIRNKTFTHPEVLDAQNVLLYWSLKDEVHTHGWVEELAKKKNVYLPVVKGDELELIRFRGRENMLQVPPYGILEPQGSALEDLSIIDIAFIPGMAFDQKGNRLGRGKAFYDRLLPQLVCKKIGICFDFQCVDQVPVEAHDIPMDELIHD